VLYVRIFTLVGNLIGIYKKHCNRACFGNFTQIGRRSMPHEMWRGNE
jgi:hypothetical protein